MAETNGPDGKDPTSKGKETRQAANSHSLFGPSRLMISTMDEELWRNGLFLRDEKGGLRRVVLADVKIDFCGRDDLHVAYDRLTKKDLSKGTIADLDANRSEWQAFISNVSKWADESGYSFERLCIRAAVLWKYANLTYDYDRFWKESGVKIEEKK